MNVEQATRCARVSRRTLYYWMTSGRLRFAAGPFGRQIDAADLRHALYEAGGPMAPESDQSNAIQGEFDAQKFREQTPDPPAPSADATGDSGEPKPESEASSDPGEAESTR